MTAAERYRRTYPVLMREFPDLSPPLDHRNPFELLIAVILSARTTDAGVNKVTPGLFRRYPDAAALAAAPVEEVERIVHSTGFFRAKTRNIIAAARLLVERHGGEVPESMEELTALPGVGRKTAHAVRIHIFDHPGIVVDTHFGRVCRRLGLTREKDPSKVERDLAALVPEGEQASFSMAANFHGRRTCHSRKPDCRACPLNAWCPEGELNLKRAAVQ